MALHGVIVADAEVAGVVCEVTGAAKAVTVAGGAEVISVGEDISCMVTAVLTRSVLEPPR